MSSSLCSADIIIMTVFGLPCTPTNSTRESLQPIRSLQNTARATGFYRVPFSSPSITNPHLFSMKIIVLETKIEVGARCTPMVQEKLEREIRRLGAAAARGSLTESPGWVQLASRASVREQQQHKYVCLSKKNMHAHIVYFYFYEGDNTSANVATLVWL